MEKFGKYCKRLFKFASDHKSITENLKWRNSLENMELK